MLDRLHEEIVMDGEQYGGLKGTGLTHKIAEMLTDMMKCIDNGESAITYTSIDLSKAFNRIDHSLCLRRLAESEASNESLRTVSGFLANRSMRIKMSSTQFSSVRPTPTAPLRAPNRGTFSSV